MTTQRTPFGPRAGGLDRPRFWMVLSPSERRWLAAVLAIACVGLCVRWWHQRGAAPEPVDIESFSVPARR